MELRADATIPFERERVFAAYRDRLTDLVPYLPNIIRIEVLERKELEGGDVELVNEWMGGGNIPKTVRGVIKESMLRWTDYATWHADSFTCAWRTEVHAIPGAVESSGTNHYLEVPEGTRLEIRGQLTCDSSKVPAVPRFLRSKVNAAVEKFLVGHVAANLKEIASGVGSLLEAER